jgi:hypothetical protein
MTLESLEVAANSLGLPMSRRDGVLDVRFRPFLTLRIRQGEKSLETESLSPAPGWVRAALVVVVGLCVGFFLLWHRPQRLDVVTVIVLASAFNVLVGMTWVSWLGSRTRERLFARAYEMQSRT